MRSRIASSQHFAEFAAWLKAQSPTEKLQWDGDLAAFAATVTDQTADYALIVSAVVGFVLQQSALRTDVLAPAMASSNAVTLFASVTFGLTVFGESLSHGLGRLVPAIIGLALALIGIVLLAGAKPPLAAEPIPKINHIPAG